MPDEEPHLIGESVDEALLQHLPEFQDLKRSLKAALDQERAAYKQVLRFLKKRKVRPDYVGLRAKREEEIRSIQAAYDAKVKALVEGLLKP